MEELEPLVNQSNNGTARYLENGELSAWAVRPLDTFR